MLAAGDFLFKAFKKKVKGMRSVELERRFAVVSFNPVFVLLANQQFNPCD